MPVFLQILLGTGKAKILVSNAHLSIDKRPQAEGVLESWEPEGETEFLGESSE